MKRNPLRGLNYHERRILGQIIWTENRQKILDHFDTVYSRKLVGRGFIQAVTENGSGDFVCFRATESGLKAWSDGGGSLPKPGETNSPPIGRTPETMCEHLNFEVEADINRITDDDKSSTQPHRWMAEIRIRCAECKLPMRFIGLPAGLDLDSPCVSVNAEEARLPIAPRGHVLSELDGGQPSGFSVRRRV